MPIFVMFSAFKNPAFREYALQNGIDAIIDKPPNQDEICNLVKRAVKTAFDEGRINPEDLL